MTRRYVAIAGRPVIMVTILCIHNVFMFQGVACLCCGGYTETIYCCRYEGEFQNGQRHGYGTLFYATGAKYQGQWQLEQKHGRGVFIFEDGTVFDGMFAHDQPVLKAGEAWGPAGPGIKLRVQDLLKDRDNQQVFP